jgi:hypothetical protein
MNPSGEGNGLRGVESKRAVGVPASSPSDWPGEILEPVNGILDDGVHGLASRNQGSDGGDRSKRSKEYDKQN